MASWTVSGPTTIDLPDDVREVRVTVVSGDVDVVAGPGAPRVEVTELSGPELRVSLEAGVLSIGYDDVRWDSILSWLRRVARREVRLSVAVPEQCDVQLGVVSASAVVAGTRGRTSVRSVSGEVVLDALTGEVTARSVSGDLETRALAGRLRFDTVSGSLTVVEGAPTAVHAHSVSGDVTLDLDPIADLDVDVHTVSGDVTVRMPADACAEVDLRSTSGRLSTGFDGLAERRSPGRSAISGRLGSGAGRLQGRTVSGNVAVLVREPA